MTLKQELNKLVLEINSITSNPKFVNYESRMSRVGQQVENSNLKKPESVTLKFDGYANSCRKEMRIRRAKTDF